MQQTLTKPILDADTIYMSAGWLYKHLGFTDRQLTMAVARRRVKVLNNVGMFPTYCVDDVKSYLRERGIEGKPPARARKGSTKKK
jgi:hypothetical protein